MPLTCYVEVKSVFLSCSGKAVVCHLLLHKAVQIESLTLVSQISDLRHVIDIQESSSALMLNVTFYGANIFHNKVFLRCLLHQNEKLAFLSLTCNRYLG